jgi:hypothetical protein
MAQTVKKKVAVKKKAPAKKPAVKKKAAPKKPAAKPSQRTARRMAEKPAHGEGGRFIADDPATPENEHFGAVPQARLDQRKVGGGRRLGGKLIQ